MSKEKPGEQPYTEEELKSLIRSGKMKIVAAETDKIEEEPENVSRLLGYLGRIMFADDDEHNDEEWIKHVFVSDRSMVSDFIRDEEELDKLSEAVGFKVHQDNYIFEVARKMKTN